MIKYIVMRDGDCLPMPFYSENLDSASEHAKHYAQELGSNTNWVCTIYENKNNFDYNYNTKKWYRKETIIKNKISMKSNKQFKNK